MSEKVSLPTRQASTRDAQDTGTSHAIAHRARAVDATALPRLHQQAAARRRTLQAFVDSHGGDAHRLLTDLADVLGASIAYVDRPTVEAHLERSLSDQEWAATARQFTAMAFDDHVGDAGSLRTDWIEDVLARAGVPGRGHTADGQPLVASPLGRP